MKRSNVGRLLDGWALVCDAFVLAVLICAMVMLTACGKHEQPNHPAVPDSSLAAPPPAIPAPAFDIPGGFDPNKPVEARYVVTGPESRTNEHATGTGAGLSTNSDEAAAKFVTSAPGATLPGIGSTGGGASTEFSVRTIQGAASNPLLWVGILAVLAAGWAVFKGIPRAGLILGVIGGGFITAAMLPAWAWVLIAAAGVVAVAAYIWSEYGGKVKHEALRAVVDGVDSLKESSPGAYQIVKQEIGKQADTRDRKTIAKYKTME